MFENFKAIRDRAFQRLVSARMREAERTIARLNRQSTERF